MIMLSLLLAGCASQPQLDPEHPTTITIWHVYGNQTKSPLNDAITKSTDVLFVNKTLKPVSSTRGILAFYIMICIKLKTGACYCLP